MNSRVIQAVARERERWPLAGDQLYLDLDISRESLSPGDRLLIGATVLEITSKLHAGCGMFTERFGYDAIRWVNSREGRELRLRGIYARVVQPGTIRVGEAVLVQRVGKLAACPLRWRSGVIRQARRRLRREPSA
jgi:hypothetical protein